MFEVLFRARQPKRPTIAGYIRLYLTIAGYSRLEFPSADPFF